MLTHSQQELLEFALAEEISLERAAQKLHVIKLRREVREAKTVHDLKPTLHYLLTWMETL